MLPLRPSLSALVLSSTLLTIGCGPAAPAILHHDAAPSPKAAATIAAAGTDRPTTPPYTGDLSIFDYPDRDKKLQIDKVMKLLKIVPEARVADIGAGSGWFELKASPKVGPNGKVYAEDINPAAIKFMAERMHKEHIINVRLVEGTVDDPKMEPHSLDAVLLLKTYHEIAHPVVFMKNLREALDNGAHVGIIDRNGDGSGTDHGVPRDVVVKEMADAGYKLSGKYDFTKTDGQDYFLIFVPKK